MTPEPFKFPTESELENMKDFSENKIPIHPEENLLRFKNDEIDKLSCVLQLNEGVNIPNLRAGIIMHAYGNERKSNQRIGRLLRLNPNDTSIVHILCYKNTVDERWVIEALKDLDQSKVKYFDVKIETDESIFYR